LLRQLQLLPPHPVSRSAYIGSNENFDRTGIGLATATWSNGSFPAGSSQQVPPCPLWRESGSKFSSLAAAPRAIAVDDAATSGIQAPKLEPRIMRYELSDYEWTAINRCCPTSHAAFGG
jgi:hypothetical protein